MSNEPHGPEDDAPAGTRSPTPGEDAAAPGPAPDVVDTVFAPQDGLSGFVPQVIRERRDGEDAPEPPAG